MIPPPPTFILSVIQCFMLYFELISIQNELDQKRKIQTFNTVSVSFLQVINSILTTLNVIIQMPLSIELEVKVDKIIKLIHGYRYVNHLTNP